MDWEKLINLPLSKGQCLELLERRIALLEQEIKSLERILNPQMPHVIYQQVEAALQREKNMLAEARLLHKYVTST